MDPESPWQQASKKAAGNCSQRAAPWKDPRPLSAGVTNYSGHPLLRTLPPLEVLQGQSVRHPTLSPLTAGRAGDRAKGLQEQGHLLQSHSFFQEPKKIPALRSPHWRESQWESQPPLPTTNPEALRSNTYRDLPALLHQLQQPFL